MIKKCININWLFIFSLLIINSCQTTQDTESKIHAIDILRSTTSVTFSGNRLWRLIPSKSGVYTDYSDDYGKTYSTPVKVNKQEQKISAWPENPPAIEVSKSGRIYVLYYADEQQKSTSYLSYSDDQGKTFSEPNLISDHAKTAMHYMDKMLIDPNDDQLYLFWHDTRHDIHDKKQRQGVLSLYYSTQSLVKNSPFDNNYISNGVCSCCRTATTFSNDGKPVIMARMVFDDGVRDHALIRMKDQNSWLPPQRVTFDNWSVEACPEHGPAIAIDETNRTHLTWFTLGDVRQGIFYAYADDFGTPSKPISLGNKDQLPSHPDVIVLNQRVVVVWKEFDGERTILLAKESYDRGMTWVTKSTNLTSKSKNSHPSLLSNGEEIFLSWTSENEGHQIIKL